ncbi:N-acetyltransferase [Candidatus Poribacteria bacterium]|nr:MAG: N-acetyltransferase [Candidatus Poribacteria bacterium]
MDDITFEYSTDSVNWTELAEVYRLAPLGTYDWEQLQRAYEDSQVCCFVYHGTQLIAAGRALSDREYFAFICDIVVLPKFQHQGIGTRIVNALSERSAAEKVLLACVIGQEGFYRKLGFLKHKSVMALYPNAEQYKGIGLLE